MTATLHSGKQILPQPDNEDRGYAMPRPGRLSSHAHRWLVPFRLPGQSIEPGQTERCEMKRMLFALNPVEDYFEYDIRGCRDCRNRNQLQIARVCHEARVQRALD